MECYCDYEPPSAYEAKVVANYSHVKIAGISVQKSSAGGPVMKLGDIVIMLIMGASAIIGVVLFGTAIGILACVIVDLIFGCA